MNKPADFFMNPQVVHAIGRDIMTGCRAPERNTTLVFDSRFGDYSSSLSVCASSTTNNTARPISVSLNTRIPKIKKLQVASCVLPMSFPQYSHSLQNTSFAVGNGNDTDDIVTIPDGNYSAVSIASWISSLSGTGLGFSVNENTGRIVIENITNIATGSPAVANPSIVQVHFAVTADAVFDKYRLKSKLGWCIGFRKPMYSIEPGARIEAEAAFQTHPTKYVYLVVNDFIQQSRTSLQTCTPESMGSAMAKITLDPVSYPANSDLPSSEKRGNLLSGMRTYPGTTDLERLSIYVCDEYGRALNMNQADFSVDFEVEHLSV